jgi:radical SAM protein with 4Fe4S-binding SPASM domain
MANLLFTNVCNRNCPYCFAKEKTGNFSEDMNSGLEKSNYISFDNLVKFLDFLDVTNEKYFSVLGGEPILHPEFGKFIRYSLSRNFAITVFTNGMMRESVLDDIEKLRKDFELDRGVLKFVVNINESQLRSAREDEMQRNSFSRLDNLASLSFNIYRPDHNFSFLIETIKEFGLSGDIRLGLAQPIVGKENQYLLLSDYRAVMERLLDLSKECDDNNVVMGMDCGFPMCLLNEEELGRMFKAGVNINFTCGPPVDVGPDLKLWFCFPLSSTSNHHLSEFKNLPELIDCLRGEFDEYISRCGIYEECASCKYLARNQCGGGCIAHYYKSEKEQAND